MRHTLTSCTPMERLAAASAGVLLGVSMVAWAQEPLFTAGPAPTETSEWHFLTELVRGGGLPAVLAALAWWLRGALGSGIPLVVQLHEHDRELLQRLRRED